MQVHILIKWEHGTGEDILAVYKDMSNAVAHAERQVEHFNKTCPGRRADGSRYVAKRDGTPPTSFSATWSFDGGGWCIASHEVQ